MVASQRVVVVGAGGQARDTAWLIQELRDSGAAIEFVGFVLSDLTFRSERDDASRLLGDFSWLESHRDQVDALALGIGTPGVRLHLARQLQKDFPDLEWPALVHPRAIFDRRSSKLGRGTMIAAQAVGSVNLTFEDFSLVNIGVTLGHEARIGAGTVVNHAASISGGVSLGEGVLVGTGARILQYLNVGAGATVGAGAVVTRHVEAGVVVVGIPARPMGSDKVRSPGL